jgi:acyl-CoA carboxylase epsilon subunit
MLGIDPKSKGGRPVQEIRIIRGKPDPQELAAVVTVLVARAAAVHTEAPAPDPVSRWRESARPPAAGALARGAGAWRASALPGRH